MGKGKAKAKTKAKTKAKLQAKVRLSVEDCELVKQCIAHWERLRDGDKRELPYSDFCALCLKYNNYVESKCKLNGKVCPLAKVYGRCGAYGRNPWRAARNAWNASHRVIAPPIAQVKIMQRMIDALESLLPKKERRGKQ